ncbi:hypothetical protein QQ020_14065 [Fulvivirgaceae bacterium BMA12]|uniref:Uncharacterized protein n=1 Tax=Agaribacillus aureus TaxID=3051825 RepID=A0ABT8L620_9BACT|nr:hypothetical protein [Fulvivirgaceae bacterium BMA12]
MKKQLFFPLFMKSAALLLAPFIFSSGLHAQVKKIQRDQRIQRPAKIKANPNILKPGNANSMKIIKSGSLNVRNGAKAYTYTATTLPDGKVMVAWSTNYPKGEATFFTPTLTPYAPVVFTDNNIRGGTAFEQQQAVTLSGGKVLLAYLERYEPLPNKRALRIKYVVFNKNGEIALWSAPIDFTPKSRNSLKYLNVTTNPGGSRAYIYFTESYRESFRGGANDNFDTYYFATDERGRMVHPVKKVLHGYNTFAPKNLNVITATNGGLFLGYKKRDLFVDFHLGPDKSPEWKVQATHNIYDLTPVGVHPVNFRDAMLIYVEGKAATNNQRLVCQVVGEGNPGEKKIIVDRPVNPLNVKTLSLKDRSVFISVTDGSSKGSSATGWIIDQTCAVKKGPFRYIEDFKYHTLNFAMTQLINGQVFVMYQDKEGRPRYVVVD